VVEKESEYISAPIGLRVLDGRPGGGGGARGVSGGLVRSHAGVKI